MYEPTFSVIMPCFNTEATLQAAVTSVLLQQNQSFELIIVDDGSTDNSQRLALSLAHENPRIRVISQHNAGPAAARNRGMAEARGKFVAFLDADDCWTPDHLALHLDHFEADLSCGVSFGRVRFFDSEMRRPGRTSAAVKSLSLADTLGEYPLYTTSNLVCRRLVYEETCGFDPGLTHGEDQEFVARVLAKTSWKVCGLRDITVHCRTSPNGLSSNLEKTFTGWQTMLQCVRAYAPLEAEAAAPRATAIFLRYLARRALRTRQPRASLRPLLEAWRVSPRAMLTMAPRRTLLTTLGVALAMLPGNPAERLLIR